MFIDRFQEKKIKQRRCPSKHCNLFVHNLLHWITLPDWMVINQFWFNREFPMMFILLIIIGTVHFSVHSILVIEVCVCVYVEKFVDEHELSSSNICLLLLPVLHRQNSRSIGWTLCDSLDKSMCLDGLTNEDSNGFSYSSKNRSFRSRHVHRRKICF